MVSITKLFGSYGANCELSSFTDEMRFFTKMSILDWCGVAYAAKKEPVSKIVSEIKNTFYIKFKFGFTYRKLCLSILATFTKCFNYVC